MNSALHLRLLTEADLPFADSVRALAGWNQTLADWRRFLAMAPDGCFLAEWNGAPAGTATTTVYGPELAWIGMVLVHPEFRRRGIGTALLQRCMDYLLARGVRCIKLDATPAGKPVYVALGFKDEWALTRWQHANPVVQSVPDPAIRNWRETDLQFAAALDMSAFGISRQTLLQTLAAQSHGALTLETESGECAGYGMIRRGARSLYLGPITARSANAGLRLVAALLAPGGQSIFWDIPDLNAAAVAWAEKQGFTRQRSLMRMYLGENTTPGDPRKQFALAGPEVG
jgi:ribosomal protein S18 acetylase RimI-like enzyme